MKKAKARHHILVLSLILFWVSPAFSLISNDCWVEYTKSEWGLFGGHKSYIIGPEGVGERIEYKVEIACKYGSAGCGVSGSGWYNSDPTDARVRLEVWGNAFTIIKCRVTIAYKGGPDCPHTFIREFNLRPTIVKKGNPLYIEIRIDGPTGNVLPTKIWSPNVGGQSTHYQGNLSPGFHTIRLNTNNWSAGNYGFGVSIKDRWNEWVFGVGEWGSAAIKFKVIN